jgi:hypothetical protein
MGYNFPPSERIFFETIRSLMVGSMSDGDDPSYSIIVNS